MRRVKAAMSELSAVRQLSASYLPADSDAMARFLRKLRSVESVVSVWWALLGGSAAGEPLKRLKWAVTTHWHWQGSIAGLKDLGIAAFGSIDRVIQIPSP